MSDAPSRFAAGRAQAMRLYRSRRLRRALLILIVIVLLFGAFGFLAAPSIIKSQLRRRASAALGRPVTVGAVHLNPYSLRLELDRLHIGDIGDKAPLLDIDSLVVDASWAAVFERAPILDALVVQHPQLHLVRHAPQRFNVSDILERFAAKPGDPPSSPTRFALANIRVRDGDIQFDDQYLGAQHHVEQLELGIPFIANTPSRVDVFVQPLLALRVDGSPLRIEGQTKPFADSRESVMQFGFDHLDLPRYLSYAPTPLPVTMPSGQLSGQVQLHFITAHNTPSVRLDGELSLDAVKLATADKTPLLELGSLKASFDDIEPLLSRYDLRTLALDHATLHYARLPGGRSSIDALLAPAPASTPSSKPVQLRIDRVQLQDVSLDYADSSGKTPIRLGLDKLHGTLQGLSTQAGSVALVDLGGELAGGQLATVGKLDLSHNSYSGSLDAKQLTLATLMPLAPPLLRAEVSNGHLAAHGQLAANWGKAINLHLEPATLDLDDLALSTNKHATPVRWRNLHVALTRFDLAGNEAQLDTVRLTGLALDARRRQDGRFDLMDLVATPKPAARAPARHAPDALHWSIAHVVLDDATVNYRDDKANFKHGQVVLKANSFVFDHVTDDTRQPVKLALDGGIGKGKYVVNGSLRPQPLDADLRIKSTQLDLAPFSTMIDVPLNVRIVSAQLGLDGHVRYIDRGTQPARVSYQGRAALGRVRVLDKATDDDFLHWSTLGATGINLHLGDGAPQVEVGALALDDFYARVIVNANGRINLQDVVASPQETAPVSVTRAQDSTAAKPATAASSSVAQAPAPTGPAARVHIGQVTVGRGQLNYTDNFIKPNYTANITGLSGKVGSFGTDAGPPAALNLNGQLDDNAPVDIAGSINPLAPVAFLDIKAKADGVELTHLSPYSGKYAGYPIAKGRLNVDVHYLLDAGKLSADNHIFIDQLTFGDRIDGPGVSHLPVKLAVALLKDSQGRIDVHIPVSGSLNDPHFSVGGLVWHAIVNLIAKAATAPFKLLASAFGGGGGNNQDIGYVTFAPGSSVLSGDDNERLAKIVTLLNQKPSLNLDIIGREDPSVDEQGLRHEMVEDLVRQERDHDKEDASGAPMSPADHDHYLEKAYKHAKFKKERDLIGLTKSKPPQEMQALLEQNMPVDGDALRHLAERRADTVRQWLRGKVADNRVFVSAPKLDAKGIDDGGKTTRVDFGLH